MFKTLFIYFLLILNIFLFCFRFKFSFIIELKLLICNFLLIIFVTDNTQFSCMVFGIEVVLFIVVCMIFHLFIINNFIW